jgi:hypothetical protein
MGFGPWGIVESLHRIVQFLTHLTMSRGIFLLYHKTCSNFSNNRLALRDHLTNQLTNSVELSTTREATSCTATR